MRTVIWTRRDTATIAALLMMTLVATGLSVKSGESGGVRIAGNSSDWKCYPQAHNRGQLACFNMADNSRSIAPDSTASLKLSGVLIALR
jgi:hypothetical protein